MLHIISVHFNHTLTTRELEIHSLNMFMTTSHYIERENERNFGRKSLLNIYIKLKHYKNTLSKVKIPLKSSLQR